MNRADNINFAHFVLALLIISAISGVCSDMYIAAFPVMAKSFDVSISIIKWTISLFFIGLSLSQLFYGPLSDFFGRRNILIYGLIIFISGSCLCTVAQSFITIIIGRFIQGVGVGAATTISRAMLRDRYTGTLLSKAFAYVGIGIALVPALAPIIGSHIQYYFGWRFEFLFMLLYAVVLLIIIMGFIPETNKNIYKYKKTIRHILSEYKYMFRDETFFANVFIASIVLAMVYIFYAITSMYLQNILHWSEIQYSYITIVVTLSLIVGRRLNIFLIRKITPEQVVLTGAIIALISSFLLYVFSFFKIGVFIALLVPISVFEIASGLIYSNTFVNATKRYNINIGSITSLYGFVQMLIVFILISLSALLRISTIRFLSLYMILLLLISILFIWKSWKKSNIF